jgi:curved DNA-binding protein CbpA
VSPPTDHYRTLGVARTATAREIKRAYRRLAKQLHPDKTGGNRAGEERLKGVNAAYGVVGNASRRREYDGELEREREREREREHERERERREARVGFRTTSIPYPRPRRRRSRAHAHANAETFVWETVGGNGDGESHHNPTVDVDLDTRGDLGEEAEANERGDHHNTFDAEHLDGARVDTDDDYAAEGGAVDVEDGNERRRRRR